MTKTDFVKRLASSIMKCGKGKIWIDPSEKARIKEASTRETVRGLISDGLVIKRPDATKTRYNIRIRKRKKEKGRRSGDKWKKGKDSARNPPKKLWMAKVREQRIILKEQRDSNLISKTAYRELYYQVKGNLFKSKKALLDRIHKDELKRREVDLLAEQMNAIKAV